MVNNNEVLVTSHNFGTEEEPIYRTLTSVANDIDAIRALDANASIDDLLKIKSFWIDMCPRNLTPEMYNVFVEKGLTIEKSYEEITLVPNASSEAYGHWVRQKHNDIVYETVWKLNKYNATDKDGNSFYAKYLNKFVTISDSGERHLKATAPVLCLIFYVSLILSIIFVIKYPIALAQGRWEGRRKRRGTGEE